MPTMQIALITKTINNVIDIVLAVSNEVSWILSRVWITYPLNKEPGLEVVGYLKPLEMVSRCLTVTFLQSTHSIVTGTRSGDK